MNRSSGKQIFLRGEKNGEDFPPRSILFQRTAVGSLPSIPDEACFAMRSRFARTVLFCHKASSPFQQSRRSKKNGKVDGGKPRTGD